ncbi:glycosyltransferase family 2 protein [Mesorhizobium sp. M0514]|uniref:glycosyltransferase family 2 protein n=1 Tax=Mesorhizobium sp. M0514 TaxID=2956955 RepID=UPI00333B6FA7
MKTAVVVPCLNEKVSLIATCLSLGFSRDATPPDSVLILVDNGSTDGTLEVMKAIKNNSPGTVLLGQTLERGYVPPRHLGVSMAKSFADEVSIPNNEFLILQADADTIYDRGFIASMTASARSAPQDLIEGIARTTESFLAEYPGYHACCACADEAVSRYFVPEADEVIVDDKVAGYRLSEYLKWGGHRREFGPRGDEIHAETSRLFIRAKTVGARRTRAPEAVAYPSRRKIEANPLGTFATAGFPRESWWWARWAKLHPNHHSLREFDRSDALQAFANAVFVRQVHTLILFALVPTHVRLAVDGHTIKSLIGSPLVPLLERVDVAPNSLRTTPGQLLEGYFDLAERQPELFAYCIEKAGDYSLP